MTRRAPVATMPVAAVVLVGAVLGVQLAQGGGRFERVGAGDYVDYRRSLDACC